MSYQSLSKIKPIIGTILLLGMLGVGLASTWNMDHVAMAHHGCVGLSAGAPSCMILVDIVSCIQVHLGVLQGISQATPVNVSQLLTLFVVVVALWFSFKWKRGESDALSRLRLRLQRFDANPRILFNKIEQWLTLHEKRDPAPSSLVVLGVLPVPIM